MWSNMANVDRYMENIQILILLFLLKPNHAGSEYAQWKNYVHIGYLSIYYKISIIWKRRVMILYISYEHKNTSSCFWSLCCPLTFPTLDASQTQQDECDRDLRFSQFLVSHYKTCLSNILINYDKCAGNLFCSIISHISPERCMWDCISLTYLSFYLKMISHPIFQPYHHV